MGELSSVSTDNDDAALEREFDLLMAKAGARVPAERKAGIVAGYKDMKRMAALLRQPRTAADEPSNTYSLVGFLRRSEGCSARWRRSVQPRAPELMR